MLQVYIIYISVVHIVQSHCLEHLELLVFPPHLGRYIPVSVDTCPLNATQVSSKLIVLLEGGAVESSWFRWHRLGPIHERLPQVFLYAAEIWN